MLETEILRHLRKFQSPEYYTEIYVSSTELHKRSVNVHLSSDNVGRPQSNQRDFGDPDGIFRSHVLSAHT